MQRARIEQRVVEKCKVAKDAIVVGATHSSNAERKKFNNVSSPQYFQMLCDYHYVEAAPC